MGERSGSQGRFFYRFNLEDVVPADHLLRKIDKVLDLSSLRSQLAPHYSHTGRPSIDPELMIRILLIGYCYGVRSERRLCEEVHLNLAYRWFCRLGLESDVPDHSTFSKNRHGRFRDADILRRVFETTVQTCMDAGLVGGEYLAALDRAVAPPKEISLSDPASRLTAAVGKPAFFGWATNYLIDVKNAVIMDVAATPAIRSAEVNSAKVMINRVEGRFGVKPKRLIGDTAYGTGEMVAWMIEEKAIEPHVPLWDKGERDDGTFSRSDFVFDADANTFTCPGGTRLQQYRYRNFAQERSGVTKANTRIYRASKVDCGPCALKQQCCPGQPMRKVMTSIHEAARDVVRRLRGTPDYLQSRRDRKKVEMLFAHLKRILKLDRLRLRGYSGAHDEFTLAAAAQNLRKLAKLVTRPPPMAHQAA